jgi:hypothetical protein
MRNTKSQALDRSQNPVPYLHEAAELGGFVLKVTGVPPPLTSGPG